MKISVVLPTMNERENVEELGKKLYNLKQLYGDLYEAIFVLNNSTDGTEEVLQNMQKQSGYEFLKIEKSKPGRGAAMRRGVGVAQGDTIVLMDSDGQYDPRDIPKIVYPILEGYDIVVPRDYESRSFLRRFYSIAFTKLTKLLLGVEYVQPGFKAGTKEALQTIFDAIQNASGLDVDVRLMNEAVKKYKISDGKVDAMIYPRRHGKTTFTPTKLALGLFYTVFSLAIERRTGRELPIPQKLKEFTLYPKRNLSELSNRIEIFQKNMWSIEQRLHDKFISKFGLDGVLKIIYNDGEEIVAQKYVDPNLNIQISDVSYEFREKWLNGGFRLLNDLRASDVQFFYSDSNQRLRMTGNEFVNMFSEIVPYARRLKLNEMRSEQFWHLCASLAETFLLFASVGLFALNLYYCRYEIKDDINQLLRKLKKL